MQSPFYGARRIAAQLQREGMGINRKTVARYMSEMGITAIYPGPNLSKRNQKARVYPFLLRHITSAYPNHIWGIDNQVYSLTSWMDVSGGDLGQTVPLICNSDRGSHFTSPQYCQLLQAANVQISMDGKGRALDNIFTERLWRTVKYEEVYVRTVQPKPVVSDGRMADKDKNLDN
jgi:putative transposase